MNYIYYFIPFIINLIFIIVTYLRDRQIHELRMDLYDHKYKLGMNYIEMEGRITSLEEKLK